MNISSVIKSILTIIRYPLIGQKLLLDGCRKFYIGRNANINSRDCISIGDNFSLGNDSKITIIKEYHGSTYYPQLNIGKNADIGNRFTALVADKIDISDDVLIASDVLITTENHGINPESEASYACQPLTSKCVTIGPGCWIGEKVTILPGVTLGKKCIVASNAVVADSFPDYCIVGGVPAKIIKEYDFNQHEWVKPTKDKKSD